MQLLNLVVWIVNVIEGSASSVAPSPEDPLITPGSAHPPKRPHLDIPTPSTSAGPPSDINHVWIALASLPWLDKENNCLDLKVTEFKKFLNASKRIKWAKGELILYLLNFSRFVRMCPLILTSLMIIPQKL